MRITLKDISERTGISKSVISMYLNKDPNVRLSDAKKVLIDKTVQETGYRPSSLARALRCERSNMLGMVLGGITDPYYSRMAEAVLYYAEKHNYQLLMQLTSWNPEKELRSIESLMDRQVDGIFYAPQTCLSDELAGKIERSGIPLVHTLADYKKFFHLQQDFSDAFTRTAEFLKSKGRKRAVLCSGPFKSQYNEPFMKTFSSLGFQCKICNITNDSSMKDLLQKKPEVIISGCVQANMFIQMARARKIYKNPPDIISFYHFDVDQIEDPWITGIIFGHFYDCIRKYVDFLIEAIKKKKTKFDQASLPAVFYTTEEFQQIRNELPDTLEKYIKQQKGEIKDKR